MSMIRSHTTKSVKIADGSHVSTTPIPCCFVEQHNSYVSTALNIGKGIAIARAIMEVALVKYDKKPTPLTTLFGCFFNIRLFSIPSD